MTTTATTNRRKLLGNNGLVVVKAQSPLDKIGLNSDIWKRSKQTFDLWVQDVEVKEFEGERALSSLATQEHGVFSGSVDLTPVARRALLRRHNR